MYAIAQTAFSKRVRHSRALQNNHVTSALARMIEQHHREKYPDLSDAEIVAKLERKAARKAEKRAKRQRDEEEENDETLAAMPSSSSSNNEEPDRKKSKAVDLEGSGDVASWRAEKHVGIEDGAERSKRWDPLRTFPECQPHFGSLMTVFKDFQYPTPIQAQAWPILLSGRDLVGLAATGSGKTLAFLMPAMIAIRQQNRTVGKNEGPAMLIVAPTRELAQQTGVIADAACAVAKMRAACVYGGMPKGPQAEMLTKGVHILTGTPGRLLDLYQDGVLKLNKVTHLVLDEADRMLDMGFEKDIRAIIGALPQAGPAGGRQTAMFSATWPTAIQGIASEFLHRPVKVTIGQAAATGQLAASHSVKQEVEVVQNPMDRDNKLLGLLQQYHGSRTNRVLVFGLYKKECDRLERFLKSRGWNCVAIHGDMSQTERNKSFEAFKSGKVPLLIATDVAA